MLLDTITMRLKPVVEYVDFERAMKEVGGFLHPLEGYALMTMAEMGPGTGAIVEIGSFKGRSTCFLAHGTKRTGREKVYAVDHFQGSPEHQAGEQFEDPDIMAEGTTYGAFDQNVRAQNLADQIVVCPAGSPDAAKDWNKPIRLLFIDGDHDYEATKRDFETWSPFVCQHGLIVFHDLNGWEGVTKFYNELLATNPAYVQTMIVYSLGVVQRVAPQEFPAHVRLENQA